jgi:RNA polymerase sigma factor (sigma-70 family)
MGTGTFMSSASGLESEDDSTKIIQGDLIAFEKFYESHHKQLYRYVCRRLNTPQRWGTTEDVEDIVATAFANLYKDIGKFDPARGSLAGFLYLKTKNAIAQFGKEAQKHDKNLSHLDIDQIGEFVGKAPDVDIDLLDLKYAISELPKGDKVLATLIIWGLSSKEIGKILGKSPGAVRAKAHELRKWLRNRLGH